MIILKEGPQVLEAIKENKGMVKELFKPVTEAQEWQAQTITGQS